MSSSITLKNLANTEFKIEHPDGIPAKSISSKDMTVAVDTVVAMQLLTPHDGMVCIVRDFDRGGTFIYDSTKVGSSNQGTNFIGWIRQYSGSVNVKWFGAKGDGTTDDTVAIQNAINLSTSIYSPLGIYKFSTLTINKRGSLFYGDGQRTIFIHTGSGTAIKCEDLTNTIYPSTSNAYVNDGQFTFRDFTLYTSGDKGFDFSKNRTSGSSIERVYMKPFAYYSVNTGSTYIAGTTAISCDNTPWNSNAAVYGITVRQCWFAGYENISTLNQIVNFWEFSNIYGVDNLRFLNLSPVSGAYNGVSDININDSYFESGVASSKAIVFGVGGGNNINISNTTIELTNVAATQYAYDFSSGGTWSQINIKNIKYLITGDGNAVNSKRIIGTAPLTFMEIGRTYTNSTLAKDIPMIWSPSTALVSPFQLPSFSRVGGLGLGTGTILLGRSGTDASDARIENDNAYGINFIGANSSSLVDFTFKNAGGTTFLTFKSYTTPSLYAGANSAYDLGLDVNRWKIGYFTTLSIGSSGTTAVIKSGTGSPESVVTAGIGSLYTRTDGGAGTTLYIKESGTGNTGWTAK